MGLNYRTSSANPLDYMYRTNTPLMEKVVDANDSYITQNLQQGQALDNMASNFPYLQADEDRANQITQGYSKQIDDITSAIRKDPANWRRQLEPMRAVQSDLQNNYRTGEISKIATNYGQYKKVSDTIDKQMEEYNKTGKGISADRGRAYKQYFLNQFTQNNPKGTDYNSQTGDYNAIKTFDPMANMDVNKVLGDGLDKLKADKNSYKKDAVTGDEWYLNEKSGKWEGITPEKVLGIVADRLNNTQLNDYLKQDQQVGLIKNAVDDNGNIVAPYSYKGMDISPDEQKGISDMKVQISKTRDPNLKSQLQSQLTNYEGQLKYRKVLNWNNDSYLAPTVRGLVNQFSYSQNDDESTLKNNQKKSTQYVQGMENYRQGRTLAQTAQIDSDKEKAIQKRFDDTMDFNKFKYMNPQAKPGTKAKAGAAPGPSVTDQPLESGVSRLNTRSFEDWMTTDVNDQPVKVLSLAGLQGNILKFRDQISDLKGQIGAYDDKMKNYLGNRDIKDLNPVQLNAYNNLRVQKEQLEGQLPSVQSDFDQRVKWFNDSKDAALSNNPATLLDTQGNKLDKLTQREIDLYKQGQAGLDKRLADYHSLKDETNKLFRQSELGSGLSEQARQIALSKYNDKYKQLAQMGTGESTFKTNDYIGNDITSEYNKVKQKVDQRRENILAQTRYHPIDTDAIQVGQKDNDAVANMLFSSPTHLGLYDNMGNKTDKVSLEGKGISWFDPKGDNYNMSETDDSQNILNYMRRYGVTPIVKSIGTTTKIGSGGAVAEIQFNDPTGNIPRSSFYMELTPQLQKQISTKFSASSDPGIKKIATDMGDDEANDIRRQMITPSVQRTAGTTGKIEPVHSTVYITRGNRRIPFQVTRLSNEDGTDHFNVTVSKDGTQVPLPQTQSGIPGWFNGAEDFINYIKNPPKVSQK